MKVLIENTGIILILLSVVILVIYVSYNIVNNTILAISGIILIIGLFVYIITNKIIKNNGSA